jgi:hypothetical protein
MNNLVTRVGVENELITKVRIRNVKSILSNIFEVSGGAGSVEGAWVVKGDWDGSTNVFPNTSVLKGYQYENTANSTTLLMPDGGIIPAGAIIVAKIDNPGQTVGNWLFLLSVI